MVEGSRPWRCCRWISYFDKANASKNLKAIHDVIKEQVKLFRVLQKWDDSKDLLYKTIPLTEVIHLITDIYSDFCLFFHPHDPNYSISHNTALPYIKNKILQQIKKIQFTASLTWTLILVMNKAWHSNGVWLYYKWHLCRECMENHKKKILPVLLIT